MKFHPNSTTFIPGYGMKPNSDNFTRVTLAFRKRKHDAWCKRHPNRVSKTAA